MAITENTEAKGKEAFINYLKEGLHSTPWVTKDNILHLPNTPK